jgi:hypothetical protein
MPSIQLHGLYEAFLNIVVSSPRPDAAPSHIIPNAQRHDEICSVVLCALDEFKHLPDNSDWVPTVKQLATYLPATAGQGWYAVRAINPAGTIVDVDEDFALDMLRIRFGVIFAILPAAIQADERSGKAFQRHWQAAIKKLLNEAYGLNDIFIPGDEGRRPGDRTEIDVQLELGPGSTRIRADKASA